VDAYTEARRLMRTAKTLDEHHRAALQLIQALKAKPTPTNTNQPKAKP
jgi:hypothetical protein